MTDRALPPLEPETAKDPAQEGAVPFRMSTLLKRSDFLAASRAKRFPAGGFLLQARRRRDGEADADLTRVGYTCSKKIGNAVARNRAKRRLREIARLVMPGRARAGWDYVLVGRPGVTGDKDFAALTRDLEIALRKIHEPRK